MEVVLQTEKPLEQKVTLKSDRLQKYFPKDYTPRQMEDIIIKLLEQWQRRRNHEQER